MDIEKISTFGDKSMELGKQLTFGITVPIVLVLAGFILPFPFNLLTWLLAVIIFISCMARLAGVK